MTSLAGRLYAPLRETFHRSRADLFVSLVDPRPGMRVLDLGGGDGSFAARLAERVPLDVTVADPEPTRVAAERYGFATREVRPGRPLPFPDDAFDVVLCNSVIEHATVWEDDGGGDGRAAPGGGGGATGRPGPRPASPVSCAGSGGATSSRPPTRTSRWTHTCGSHSRTGSRTSR